MKPNFNSIINNAIIRAVFGRKGYPVPLNTGNRIPGTAIANRNTNKTRVSQAGERRGNRRTFGRPLEINRAEGGFKSVVTRGRLVPIVINTYGRLTYYHQGNNVFQPLFQLESDNYTSSSDNINVSSEMNISDEFTENRKRSEEYRVTNVCLSIDYNRVPQAGDRVSKLLLTTVCDKLDQTLQTEMKKENNVMMLSMSANGVKNYNTKLDVRTTEVANLNWQNSNYTWPGVWKIRMSQQDITTLTRLNDEAYIVLGTWKLSIRVLFRLTDLQNVNVSMSNPPNLANLVKEVELLRQELEKTRSIVKEQQELLKPVRLGKPPNQQFLLTEQTTGPSLLPGQPGRSVGFGSSRTEEGVRPSSLLPGQPGRSIVSGKPTSQPESHAEKRSGVQETGQVKTVLGDWSFGEPAQGTVTNSPGLLDLLP
jgi:hypothetical protein